MASRLTTADREVLLCLLKKGSLAVARLDGREYAKAEGEVTVGLVVRSRLRGAGLIDLKTQRVLISGLKRREIDVEFATLTSAGKKAAERIEWSARMEQGSLI